MEREINIGDWDSNGFGRDISLCINDVSEVMSNGSFLDFNIQRTKPIDKNKNSSKKKQKSERSDSPKSNNKSKFEPKVSTKNTKVLSSNKEQERAPLPVFECIFCARSDRNLANMLNIRLYNRFNNILDKYVVAEKYNSSSADTNVQPQPTEGKHEFKVSIRSIVRQAGCYKPRTHFQLSKVRGTGGRPNPSIVIERLQTPNKQIREVANRGRELCPAIAPDHFLDQSSCINFRSSSKKLRKRNVSYESGYHNIYAPEFSSSDENEEIDEISSLEISFELNDSYEELRLEHCLSMESKEGDKSLKVNRFKQAPKPEKRSIEPLYSISPKKYPYSKGSQNCSIQDTCCYNNITKSTRQDSGLDKYPNDSYDMKKQSMYYQNDHLSSFSTALDFTKYNNLKFVKSSSIERTLKSSEGIDLTQENNTLNSNRMGSDYETMLKTANSFGSFINHGKYPSYQQRSKDGINTSQCEETKIFYPRNGTFVETIYKGSQLALEKAKSYPVNQSRVSQTSMQGSIALSRESMNLTPQLQSPDVNIHSTKSTHRQRGASKSKNQMPLSRNHKNMLSKKHMQSCDGSQMFINSFISNSSQSNLHQPQIKPKAYPIHSFFPAGGRLKYKFQQAKSKVSINAGYINSINKSKSFKNNKFNPNCAKISQGGIVVTSRPELKRSEKEKKYLSNYLVQGKPTKTTKPVAKKPKLNRCQSFVQKPVKKNNRLAEQIKTELLQKYLSKEKF